MVVLAEFKCHILCSISMQCRIGCGIFDFVKGKVSIFATYGMVAISSKKESIRAVVAKCFGRSQLKSMDPFAIRVNEVQKLRCPFNFQLEVVVVVEWQYWSFAE